MNEQQIDQAFEDLIDGASGPFKDPRVPRKNPRKPVDERPLLEAVSDFLQRLESTWTAGKPIRSLLAEAQGLRKSVERALAQDDERTSQ